MAQNMLGIENDVDIVDFSILQSPDAFPFYTVFWLSYKQID